MTRYEVIELAPNKFVILDHETGERLRSIYLQPILMDSRETADRICRIWNESDELSKKEKNNGL